MEHRPTTNSDPHGRGVGGVAGAFGWAGMLRRRTRRQGRFSGAGPGRRSHYATVAAVLVTAVLVASACQWPPGVADDPALMAMLGAGSVRARPPGQMPDDDGGGVLVDRVYVEARARLAADGAVEVSARVNATALNWQPQRHLFDYPNATVGEWWTSTPIGPADVGVSTVRIQARRLADDRIELAVLTPDGQEVHPREPLLSYTSLGADDWTYTTPVVLTAAGEPAPTPRHDLTTENRFVSIGVGDRGGCGLRGDGTIDCWSKSRSEAMPVVGPFTDLSSGCWHHIDGDLVCGYDITQSRLGPFIAASGACGVRPSGTIECSESQLIAMPPGGPFVEISVGRLHACAIRFNGELACWGDNSIYRYSDHGAGTIYERYPGPVDAPSGLFTAVAAGWHHTCGIHTGGEVACWGDNYYGQSTPPEGTFTTLRVARDFTCGLRSDGTASCWGGRPGTGDKFETHVENAPSPPPLGYFVALDMGSARACGLRASGNVDCWYPGSSYPEAEGRTHFDSSTGQDYGAWSVTYEITYVPAGLFQSLSIGARHACGIRSEGDVICWGADLQTQSSPPIRVFDTLDAGGYHTCGLLQDGGVHCWGDNSLGQLDAPPGVFAVLTAGWQHTCALRISGLIACWGQNSHGAAKPPSGSFAAISAGGRHSCATNTAGQINCWGDDTYGQSSPPNGPFTELSSGALHTCALRPNGTAECWGDDRYEQSTVPPGTFSAISAGWDYTCALRSDKEIECWGAATGEPGAVPPPRGPFSSVHAGSQIACGIRADGTAECWIATGQRTIDASGEFPTTRAPTGLFRSLSAGDGHTCAIRTDNMLACWGQNIHAQATPPAGAYKMVSAGANHTCAINLDSVTICWGENTFGQASAPASLLRAISAGTYHTCGIDSHDSLTCWGDDTYEQTTTPGGRFRAVTAGERHTCGLRPDHTIVCWGDDTFGQITPPAGTYHSITAGKLHTCALSTHDRHITCWGYSSEDDEYSPFANVEQRPIPQGEFIAITAGARHSCAIGTEGLVECWPRHGGRGPSHDSGYSSLHEWYAWKDSRVDPLSGSFVALSAGTYHTCGIRPDQTIDCWSANEPRNP